MNTPRIEIKYAPCGAIKAPIDESIINMGFNEIYSKRTVVSTYFDTPNDRFLWQNIEGDLFRKKLRWRQYGINQMAQIYKETKTKNGLLTLKDRSILDHSEVKYRLYPLFSKNSSCALPLPVNKIYSGLIPKAAVVYDRRYFSDNNARITLDFNIYVGNIRDNLLYPLNGATIVEIKMSPNQDIGAYDYLLETAGLARTKFSKYVAARAFFNAKIDSIYPNQNVYGRLVRDNF